MKIAPTSSSHSSLYIAGCYIPPQGSKKLRASSLALRYENLVQHTVTAMQEGWVLMAGDFNARVGSATEGEASRGCADTHINHHGRELMKFCRETGMLLGTGRLGGDEDALPTFRAKRGCQSSRIDHLLASPQLFQHIPSCSVHCSRQEPESDHLPLEALVFVPWRAGNPAALDGTAIERTYWQPHQGVQYAQTLDPQRLEACQAAAAEGAVEPAFQLLLQEATRASIAAGMKRSVPTNGAAKRKHEPWYDNECHAQKRVVHTAYSARPYLLTAKAVLRQYHKFTRRKRRAYELDEIVRVTKLQKRDQFTFRKLFRTDQHTLPAPAQRTSYWTNYLRSFATRPAPEHIALPVIKLPGDDDPNSGRLAGAEELDTPIDRDEVIAALKALNNGRSCGPSGLPAELLRYAVIPGERDAEGRQAAPTYVLADALCAVLNCAFTTGAVPSALNTSLVTPIHKRGDTTDTSNYRPIAVGEPILRMYANILGNRLNTYMEATQLRAPTQAGFRAQMSTIDQHFALNHVITRARRARKPLYCCFLDLKGAFDRVPRTLLWEALQRRGVHGRMLAAIQSLYADARYAINIRGRHGEKIQSSIGVKQGCPLSPTLFGLLLDGLHFTLAEQCSWAGPWLNSQLATGQLDTLQDLGYADDFCLLANTPPELQQVLDVAFAYLSSIGMEVSVEKTCVMVFGKAPRRGTAPHVWTCGGAALKEVQEYKYLGLVYSQKKGIAGAFSKLQSNMLDSSHKLWAKYGNLHCGTSQKLQLDLFLESVPHAASYGSEIWGILRLLGASQSERAGLAKGYLRCVRNLIRLAPSVSEDIVLRELGVDPLETLWLTRAVRYWNTLVQSPQQVIRKRILLSEVIDAQHERCSNWATSLRQALGEVGMALSLRWDDLREIDLAKLKSLLAERTLARWAGLHVCPRTCPSEGATRVKYAQWFARPEGDTRKGYIALNLGLKRTRMMLRFRMGAMYSLPIYNRDIPERQERVCQCCDSGALGDERHVLLECRALQSVRDRYAHLFTSPRTVKLFM